MPSPNRTKGLWIKYPYTNDEKEKIKKFVPKLGYSETARLIGRPVTSVHKWALKLGIKILPDMYDNLSDTQAAYIAGYLDGEACFRISGKVTEQEINHASPGISVASVDKKIILWMQDKLSYFNFKPNLACRIPRNRKAKPIYTLGIGGIKAAALAKRILPFLILKKEHAKLLIQWANVHKFGQYGLQETIIALKFYELNTNGPPRPI